MISAREDKVTYNAFLTVHYDQGLIKHIDITGGYLLPSHTLLTPSWREHTKIIDPSLPMSIQDSEARGSLGSMQCT